MYCIMIDDHETYIRERKKKEKREKKKEKKKEKFCMKVDYFRIDENDFETDLWQIIETYLKLCLFFILGEGPHSISSSHLF